MGFEVSGDDGSEKEVKIKILAPRTAYQPYIKDLTMRCHQYIQVSMNIR